MQLGRRARGCGFQRRRARLYRPRRRTVEGSEDLQQRRTALERLAMPAPCEGHVARLLRSGPLRKHVTLLGWGRPTPIRILEGLRDTPVMQTSVIGSLDDCVDPAEVAGLPLVARVRVERHIVRRTAPERHLIEALAARVRVHEHDHRLARAQRVDQGSARSVLGRRGRTSIRIRLVGDEVSGDLRIMRHCSNFGR